MPDHAPGLYARATTLLLRILPQHLLSGIMYRVARIEVTWLKNLIIRFVVRKYRVDMQLALNEDPFGYPSFNAFFTRALKPEVRPIAADGVVSPVDGKVSQCGRIASDRLVQAKGHEFSLFALLAGDATAAALFENGDFATIYLSPRDYHRIHMPLAGTLRQMVFVPGDLYSVSEATTQLVPGLFARNERVICYFDTARGPMAVILVGAIFVGSMQTVWHGEVRGEGNQPTPWEYPAEEAPRFEAGQEIARFNMGSTVILLHPQYAADFHAGLAGKQVTMGEKIAD